MSLCAGGAPEVIGSVETPSQGCSANLCNVPSRQVHEAWVFGPMLLTALVQSERAAGPTAEEELSQGLFVCEQGPPACASRERDALVFC